MRKEKREKNRNLVRYVLFTLSLPTDEVISLFFKLETIERFSNQMNCKETSAATKTKSSTLVRISHPFSDLVTFPMTKASTTQCTCM